jgi:hypothetical protein
MSFELVTEPIDRWPEKDTRPRRAHSFTATYAQTVDLLRRELDFLHAKGAAVIQVVTRNGATDLRRDGLLRAQARIEHPGVRLSFESKHGPLTYSTDVFEQRWSGDLPAWQANLRAIALGLEALRTVDCYGISRRGEQYCGWRAIEAPAGTSGMTAEDAADVLLRLANPSVAEALTLDDAALVRRVRINVHPDRHGGDHTLSDQLLEALHVLGYDQGECP